VSKGSILAKKQVIMGSKKSNLYISLLIKTTLWGSKLTRINKLVLKGFKSFGRRSELLFSNDFNCVLGPNGAGKSNILDALCFVLGKSSAKALRSEKSSNLIYNGGKKKNPGKSAEVSIYFDNTNKIFPAEEDEVKVSRIVKKSGQSVYKINDQSRTRQEVLELMSLARINPDGYNIILQGDIIRFVEMPPVERRQLVEEVAGISVYEEKKQKAVSELDRVEERLKEADIVLVERQTHLKELKKERDQAIKYKDLKDKIEVNKATFIYRRMEQKQSQKKELDDKIEAQQKILDQKQKQIDELKEKISEQKEKIEQINKQIEERGEKEQVEIHKEVEQLRVESANLKNRTGSCDNEINRIKTRKKQLTQNLEEITEKVKKIASEKEEIKAQIESDLK